MTASSESNTSLTVDDHFVFFKLLCDRANEYYVVQKTKNAYNSTKHSMSFIERTLDRFEDNVKDVLNYSVPAYENYVFPTTNCLFEAYTLGIERSKIAANRTKEIAITYGTLGLGLALIATQMGLIAGTAAMNLFLDGIIATKNCGSLINNKFLYIEKYLKEHIQIAIQVTFDLVKNPVETLSDHANFFLDIANAVFERILSLPKEEEDLESKIIDRVGFLARRIANSLTSSANNQLVEPCQRQISNILEQLQKSLILIDYLKQKREWTFQKVDDLSTSVQEYRVKVETEAKLAVTQPEDVLICSIHIASKKLNKSLVKLRESGEKLLNDSIQKRLSATISYIEKLDSNFKKAEDIYQITDDVLNEAKLKLNEISQWYN